MNLTNGAMGCLTKMLWIGCGFLFVILGFVFAAAPFGIIMSLSGTILLVSKSFYSKRAHAAKLRESLREEETPTLYQILSEKDLTKWLLAKELERQQRYGVNLRCKLPLTRKTLYTAVVLPLLAIILFSTYYKAACVPMISVIILVFVWLWNSATPEQLLYKKAKKHKKVSFVQLVTDNLYDEEATPKAKRRGVLAIGALILLLVIFFAGAAETHLDFVPTDGGMMLTSYRPALTEFTEIQVPATVDGQPVVAIDDSVFQDCSYLEKITLPDTVRSIGSRTFKSCTSLEQLTLPENLTQLGGEAFMGCTALTGIQIPQGVTELRGNTFENCNNLADVQLHDGITAIHAYCFRGCKSLEKILLPPKITEIRTYTFEGCSSLKAVDIPVGVTRIASHAFHNCTALSDVYLPDTLREIGSSAFRNCTALYEIGMPKGVTVAENAFKESLTEIREKKFTDAQWERILQEFEGTQWPNTMYYMYNLEKGISAISRYGRDGHIVLADRWEFKDRISDGRALKAISDEASLLTLFENAKAAGAATVNVYLYTQVGSEITGTTEYVVFTYNIDNLIAQLKGEK